MFVISTWSKWFPAGCAGRNVITLGLGQLFGHAILLAGTPLLTRMYSPDDFGLFAIYGAVLSVCSVVVTLRYEAAIPLAANRKQAFHLLVLTLGIALALAALCGALFLLARDTALIHPHLAQLRSYAVLLAINLAACGGYQALTFWLLHERNFQQLAVARLMNSLAMVGGQVGLGLAGSGPAGLLIGHGLGYGAGCVWMGTLAFSRSKRVSISLGESLTAAARFSRFPRISVWGALVSALATHLPVLLIAAIFSPVAAGWYLLAHRCLIVPLSLLQVPLSRTYLSESADLFRERPQDMLRLYWNVVLIVLGTAAVPVAGFMLFAPMLFGLVFGVEWVPAGEFCRILAPLLLLQLAWNSVQSTLDILGRQDIDFSFACIQVALLTAALALSRHWGASVEVGVTTLSLAGSAGFALSLLVTARLLQLITRGNDPSTSTV